MSTTNQQASAELWRQIEQDAPTLARLLEMRRTSESKPPVPDDLSWVPGEADAILRRHVEQVKADPRSCYSYGCDLCVTARKRGIA